MLSSTALHLQLQDWAGLPWLNTDPITYDSSTDQVGGHQQLDTQIYACRNPLRSCQMQLLGIRLQLRAQARAC